MSNFNYERARRQATALVNRRAAWAGAVAAFTGPLTGTSALLVGMEAQLAYKIARIYKFHPTLEESGSAMSGLVAGSTIAKTVAIEGSTAIPVIGWWGIKPAVAITMVKGIGELAINHYEQKRRKE